MKELPTKASAFFRLCIRPAVFTLLIILHAGCHDFSEGPILDNEMIADPGIADITVDQQYNIVILMGRNYSDDCAFVLERKTGQGRYMAVSYERKGLSALVDSKINKETDKDYKYRFKVLKNNQSSAYSNEVSFDYTSRSLNQPKEFQLISVEYAGIQLYWQDMSRNEEGYRIERNDGSGFVTIATLLTDKKDYMDTGIPANPSVPLNLSYRITAFDETRQSFPVTGSILYTGIGSPVNLRFTGTGTGTCTLGWEDKSRIETGYIVERNMNNGGFLEIAALDSNCTSYTDTISYTNEYIYRVKAVYHSAYSSYSNEANYSFYYGSFADPRDGNIYKTVTIGSQTWMAENLRYDIQNETRSWYYKHSPGYDTLGKYYDWETAKSAAPPGWHLPDFTEIETLMNNCGGPGNEAFNQLIEGGRSKFNMKQTGYYEGKFSYYGSLGAIWSSTPAGYYWSYAYYLSFYGGLARKDSAGISYGLPVRCIKD